MRLSRYLVPKHIAPHFNSELGPVHALQPPRVGVGSRIFILPAIFPPKKPENQKLKIQVPKNHSKI